MEFTINALLDSPLRDTLSAEEILLLVEIEKISDPLERWQRISKEFLTPNHSWELHSTLYNQNYIGHEIAPCWIPSDAKDHTNIVSLMKENNFSTYEDFYNWSVNEPEQFWNRCIERVGIVFDKPYSCVFENHIDHGVKSVEYLKDATLNIAASCFNKRKPSDVAIVYASESNAELKYFTFKELNDTSNMIAYSLLDPKNGLDLSFGDAVGICMPMTHEAVAIYLGIVKAGLSVISIADSFAPNEIETRMKLGRGKVVFTQDVVYRRDKVLPMFDRVIKATSISGEQSYDFKIIVLPGEGSAIDETVSNIMRPGKDIAWGTFLEDSSDQFALVSCPATHICNILFSSGTTGEPKAIPWTHSTPVKCAIDGYLHQDIHLGEVVAWPTNIGWMMGPWLIFQLINGATLALFNGNTGSNLFCQFVDKARVSMLGVVPSLVKAWQFSNATEGCDWSHVRRFSSTGEASDARSMHWLMSRANYSPVIEYCGGTEIAGSYMSSTMVQPNVPSMFSTPVLGSKFIIINDSGDLCSQGEIALVPPALGLSTLLLNRDHHSCYYDDMPAGPNGEVLRRHGDEIQELESPHASLGKYFRALGRCDDTMNLGGIKVSSVEIERVCNTIGGVSETAAIGVSPPQGGPSSLVLFVVVKDATIYNEDNKDKLKSALQNAIKTQLNPLFHIGDVIISSLLPRTASNKIMRRILRDDYMRLKYNV